MRKINLKEYLGNELVFNKSLQNVSHTDENINKTINALDENFYRKLLAKVFDFRNITPKDVLEICFSKAEIQDCVDNKTVVDVEKICDMVGVKIEETRSKSKHIQGGLYVGKEISIKHNIELEEAERIFLIAHELGHLFKHTINGKHLEYADKDLNEEVINFLKEILKNDAIKEKITDKITEITSINKQVTEQVLEMVGKVLNDETHYEKLTAASGGTLKNQEDEKYELEADEFAQGLLFPFLKI